MEPGRFAQRGCPCCRRSAASASLAPHPEAKADPTGHRTLRVGRATLHPLQDGAAAYPAAPTRPEHAELVSSRLIDGQLCLSFGCTLIRSCNTTVLVDTSLGDVDPPCPPDGRYRGLRELLKAAAGLTPEDIDVVVYSHAHTDHVAGGVRQDAEQRLVPAFANARYLLRLAEHSAAVADAIPNDSSQLHARWFAPLEAAGVLEVLGGDEPYRLTEEVTLLPGYEGHTAGAWVVRVRSEGESAYYIGDALHHTLQFATPAVCFEEYDWDERRAVDARLRLLRTAADEGALLLSPHLRFPGCGRVFRQGSAFEFVPHEDDGGRL